MKSIFILLMFVGQTCATETIIRQVENNRELSERVWRDQWEFSIAREDGELVVATFAVKPDKELSIEGLPESYSIETIQYSPSRSISELVSYTGVVAGVRQAEDDPYHRFIQISGLGHACRVSGLENDGGWETSNKGIATMTIRFQDTPTNPTKRLFVTLSLQTISLTKARIKAGMRRMQLPAIGDSAWSVTLPPMPEDVEPTDERELE